MFLLLQALDLIRGKNVLLLMDSSLEGQYANEDATALVELASKCLQYEAKDRPDVKFLLTAVSPLQKQKEVTSRISIFPSCFFFVGFRFGQLLLLDSLLSAASSESLSC